MRRDASPRLIRLGLAAFMMSGLCGCLADDLPPLTMAESHPRNVIERILVSCADKTVEAESACVHTGIGASGLSPAALAALVPGCRTGRVCTYDYTTEDRVGYLSAYATHLRYGFRVAFDFSKAPKSVADLPITVTVL